MRGKTAAKATAAQGMVHKPVGILVLIAGEALGLAAAFINPLVLPGRWAFLVVGRHLGLRHRLGGGRA